MAKKSCRKGGVDPKGVLLYETPTGKSVQPEAASKTLVESKFWANSVTSTVSCWPQPEQSIHLMLVLARMQLELVTEQLQDVWRQIWHHMPIETCPSISYFHHCNTVQKAQYFGTTGGRGGAAEGGLAFIEDDPGHDAAIAERL